MLKVPGQGPVESFLQGLDVPAYHWLSCFRAMGEAGARAAHDLAGTEAGRRALGRGQGGDQTVAVDRAAEDAILAVLGSEAPSGYSVVSEEAGRIGDPEAPWRVIVDPIDGSLNAKRGLDPYSVAIAGSREDAIGEVLLGYIRDCTGGHEFMAARGRGFVSTRGGSPPAAQTVEVILLEAGRPDRHAFSYGALSSGAGSASGCRVRQIGSLALCLGYVAAGIADVLFAPVPSRAVDIAAGLLMVRESGGGAAALDDGDLWAQPLDLAHRSPFLAWRAGLDPTHLLSWARGLSSG